MGRELNSKTPGQGNKTHGFSRKFAGTLELQKAPWRGQTATINCPLHDHFCFKRSFAGGSTVCASKCCWSRKQDSYHILFDKLQIIYCAVFHLWLGHQYTIVLNDFLSFAAAFRDNDDFLQERFESPFVADVHGATQECADAKGNGIYQRFCCIVEAGLKSHFQHIPGFHHCN